MLTGLGSSSTWPQRRRDVFLVIKLAKLTKVQLEQNQKGEHFSEETLILVQQYNEIVDALTKTFIEYDKLLTAAEENSKS